MDQEYEFDGHTYKMIKLPLGAAKECLAVLTSMGFFEDGLQALMRAPDDVDKIERRLFREHVQLLNEQGDWVPMGKEITEAHFNGRMTAYFALLVHAITYNYSDFLAGGWIIAQEETEVVSQQA